MKLSLLAVCGLLVAARVCPAAEVYTAASARADADRVVHYFDQGKFPAGLTVAIEADPAVRNGVLKSLKDKPAAKQVLAMLKMVNRTYAPIKNRTWVETRRTDFPLFSTTPKYRVIYWSQSGQGPVVEEVLISKRIVDKPGESKFTLNYSCKERKP